VLIIWLSRSGYPQTAPLIAVQRETDRRLLDRLANRLTKITSETRKLGQA
jgi:hypothetical protein